MLAQMVEIKKEILLQHTGIGPASLPTSIRMLRVSSKELRKDMTAKPRCGIRRMLSADDLGTNHVTMLSSQSVGNGDTSNMEAPGPYACAPSVGSSVLDLAPPSRKRRGGFADPALMFARAQK